MNPKSVKHALSILVGAVFLSVVPFVQAQAPLLSIDTVYVGNAGNAAANSTNASSWGGNYGYGAVNYDYRIGTHLVTNQQYATFLNAVAATDSFGLYNGSMGSDAIRGGINRAGSSGSYTYSVKTHFDLKPVNYVSFFNAAMFTNWLNNGATAMSSITSGAYQISSGTVTQVSRSSDVATLTSVGHTLSVGDQVVISATSGYNGTFIVTATTANTFSFSQSGSDQGVTAANGSLLGASATRDAAANWWLPSEDEWVKAAYYNPESETYSLYATQSNSAPTVATSDAEGNITNPGSNVANYNNGVAWNSGTGNVSTVGSAGASSFYGTYDQSGNVLEWNEEILHPHSRAVRGGAYTSGASGMQASNRASSFGPTFGGVSAGFRVAAVPEPTSALLLLVGAGAFLLKRGRKIFL